MAGKELGLPQVPPTADELTAAYLALIDKLEPLVRDGLAAAVYTQTTDVEIEVNGLMTCTTRPDENGCGEDRRREQAHVCRDGRGALTVYMAPRAFPQWLEPMAATLTQERFAGPEWTFERKLDGIRLLSFKNGRDVRLSRAISCRKMRLSRGR